ncbi:hypothetical protein Tco_1186355 [Tanacetum coccineum]
MMMASKSYKKHTAHKALYDALIQSLFVDENDMDQAAAAMDQSAQLKRKHDDQDEDPTIGLDRGKDKKRLRKDTQPSKKSFASKESSKGNTLPKTSKSGKSVTTKEPDEEHVHNMSLNVAETLLMRCVILMNNLMVRLHQTLRMLQRIIGSNNLQGLILLTQSGTSVKLLMINQNKPGLTIWCLLKRIYSHLMNLWPLLLTSLSLRRIDSR